MSKSITIATRNSPLALWQAEHIAAHLTQLYPQKHVKLLPMVTSGDIAGPEKWGKESGKGLFVKELEQALLDERADLAVHSMKDVPAHLPPGLVLPIITSRANPFDALISDKYNSLNDLPQGARIGTASLRRQAQLLKYRPDLKVHVIRGNVQTRLQKMHEQNLDAIILANAGLERLNYKALIRETLTPPIMIPSCGQGALGIECRLHDSELQNLLKPLLCTKTNVCVQIERAINAAMGGSCHVPIGIYCQWIDNHNLNLQTRLLSPDGKTCLEYTCSKPATEQDKLVNECINALMQQGAKELLSAI